jgi:hypothetical protein
VARAGPKRTWEPVSAAELAEKSPQVEPDAPAEAIFWHLEIDDTDFPAERRSYEYVRFKVFAPDKVEQITRVSQLAAFAAGTEQKTIDLRARLVLPDGTIREFGQDAIHERTVSKSAGDQSFLQRMFGASRPEVKEKFLAVSGVEPGAILEFLISSTEKRIPLTIYRALQINSIPIRRLDYLHRTSSESDWIHRSFVVNTNIGHAELQEDYKARRVTLVAHDVPARMEEPLAGGHFDSALTVLSSYTSRSIVTVARSENPRSLKIDPKTDGPWAQVAGLMLLMEEDRTQPTRRVRELAAQLTEGAGSALEKAHRIHRRVQEMYQHFRKLPRKPQAWGPADPWVSSLDDVLNYERNTGELAISADEFLWLAVSLYRAAGLETRVILLPDRETKRFNPRWVAMAFLPQKCAGIFLDGQWHFSAPQLRAPVPFDVLPWANEGQVGLVVQEGKQTFINIPLMSADQSVTTNTGIFQVDEQGGLTGEGVRRHTGQTAIALRFQLWEKSDQQRQDLMKERLSDEYKGAEITVTKVAGVEDPETPLEITFTMRLPAFAVMTRNRLVLRPAVFRLDADSPFTASTRHNAVQFPYPWEEVDRVTIELPPGYEPESLATPAPVQGADVLLYRTAASYEAPKHLVHFQRVLALGAVYFPVEQYATLKNWYDAIAEGDQHEVVFIKSDARKPAAAAGP